MSTKFDMGQDTLTTLHTQTSGSHDDLGALVRELGQAAEPLAGKFNGNARAVFDNFHNNTDTISKDLNNALAAVLEGVGGMNFHFQEGESAMADDVSTADKGSDYSGASFHRKG